jgi:hypothetical protein
MGDWRKINKTRIRKKEEEKFRGLKKLRNVETSSLKRDRLDSGNFNGDDGYHDSMEISNNDFMDLK